jgi:hypothetical protein
VSASRGVAAVVRLSERLVNAPMRGAAEGGTPVL